MNRGVSMQVITAMRRQPVAATGETGHSAADLLRILEFELQFLEQGGYTRSWKPRWLLIDSPVCRWQGEPDAPERCLECPLMAFAAGILPANGIACHTIALNPEGQTIDDLTRLGDHALLQQTYRVWLCQKIQSLRIHVEGMTGLPLIARSA